MSWVATAIVGTAVVSGIVQSNAASSAAKAQERAANNQLDAAERQYWNDIALATEMKQVLMGLSPTERIEKQADLDKALAKLESGEDVETARLDISRLQNQLAAEGLIDKRFAETREQLGVGTVALVEGAQDAAAARLQGIDEANVRATWQSQRAIEGATSAATARLAGLSSARNLSEAGYSEAQGYANSFANEMQGQYDRWNSIYGTLQENLGEFYNNLTPQMLSATNLQMRQREYQTAVDTVRKNFAQRGVAGGAQSAIEAGMAMDNARARAQIRADAPFQVAEAQTGFLTSTSNIRNAYTDDLQQARTAQSSLAIDKANTLANLDIAASEVAAKRQEEIAAAYVEKQKQQALLDLSAGNVTAAGIEATAQARAAGAQAGAGLSIDQLNAETNALNAAARNTSTAGQNLTSTAINVAGQQGQIQANLAQQQANAITGVLNTGMYALGKYGSTTSNSPAPVYDGFTGQRVS